MIVGGLRDRLLKDSFFAHVEQALNTLGWLDANRTHQPINLIAEPLEWDTPVPLNTIAVAFTANETFEWEVGSRLTRDVHLGYVEIFAENDSIGVHLSNDIRDWLRGRLQAGLHPGATFPIFDYRHASTPPVVGYMELDDVSALRNTTATEDLWRRHWFRVRCEVHDTYAGGPQPTLYPDPGLYPSGELYPSS